jgi:hypothetical protein
MNTPRKTAIIVGVLFISAIVMLFIGEALYKPILILQITWKMLIQIE